MSSKIHIWVVNKTFKPGKRRWFFPEAQKISLRTKCLKINTLEKSRLNVVTGKMSCFLVKGCVNAAMKSNTYTVYVYFRPSKWGSYIQQLQLCGWDIVSTLYLYYFKYLSTIRPDLDTRSPHLHRTIATMAYAKKWWVWWTCFVWEHFI